MTNTPCSSCRLIMGLARPVFELRDDGRDVQEDRGDDRYDGEDINECSSSRVSERARTRERREY